MNKFISALAPVFWVAIIVLFFYWIISISPTDFPIKGSPSGWWWFSCLLGAVFFSSLEE